MYRISHNKRKYSTTPIVQVHVDDQGRETEEIVAVVTMPKKRGDLLSVLIVEALNNLITEIPLPS
jgi:3-dehydroquinate dehydratase